MVRKLTMHAIVTPRILVVWLKNSGGSWRLSYAPKSATIECIFSMSPPRGHGSSGFYPARGRGSRSSDIVAEKVYATMAGSTGQTSLESCSLCESCLPRVVVLTWPLAKSRRRSWIVVVAFGSFTCSSEARLLKRNADGLPSNTGRYGGVRGQRECGNKER